MALGPANCPAEVHCCEGTQPMTKKGTGLVSGTSVAPSQHALIIYAY